MRKECPKCSYGTNQRGEKGDKALRRHFQVTGHHRATKEWKGYKNAMKK